MQTPLALLPAPTTLKPLAPGQTIATCPKAGAIKHWWQQKTTPERALFGADILLNAADYGPRVFNATSKALQFGQNPGLAAHKAVMRTDLISPEGVALSAIGVGLDVRKTFKGNRNLIEQGGSGKANLAGRMTHSFVKSTVSAGIGMFAGKGGALAGAKAGAFIGSFLGPVGIPVGAAIGAVAGAVIASELAKELTKKGIDKVVSEEKFGSAFEKSHDHFAGGSTRIRPP